MRHGMTNRKASIERRKQTLSPHYHPQPILGSYTPKNKAQQNREWRAQNPEKYRAHNDVHHALEFGQLIRSPFCELCLMTGRIESHHEDYSRPLEVVWLCHFCHRVLEGRKPKSWKREVSQ